MATDRRGRETPWLRRLRSRWQTRPKAHAHPYGALSLRQKREASVARQWRPDAAACPRCGMVIVRDQIGPHLLERCPGELVTRGAPR